MRMKSMLIAAGLLAGLAGIAPATAQPGPGHGVANDRGRGPGWHQNDRRHHAGNDHRRRVCHWERHRGHRVKKCIRR